MIGSIISMKNGWLQNSRETELSTKDGYILLSEMPAREILPFPLLHINIPLMSKFVACLIETHWICGSFLQLDIKGSFLWSKLAVGLLLASKDKT